MRVSLLPHIFLRYQEKIRKLHKQIYDAVESYFAQFDGVADYTRIRTIFTLCLHPNLSLKMAQVCVALRGKIIETVDNFEEIKWKEVAPQVFNVKDMTTMSGHIKSLRALRTANKRLYDKCFEEDIKWQDIVDITQYGVGNSFLLMVRYYWLWRKEKETFDGRTNPFFTNFAGLLPITSPVANSMQELFGTDTSSTLRASMLIHTITDELKQFDPTIDSHDVNSALWLMSYEE